MCICGSNNFFLLCNFRPRRMQNAKNRWPFALLLRSSIGRLAHGRSGFSVSFISSQGGRSGSAIDKSSLLASAIGREGGYDNHRPAVQRRKSRKDMGRLGLDSVQKERRPPHAPRILQRPSTCPRHHANSSTPHRIQSASPRLPFSACRVTANQHT